MYEARRPRQNYDNVEFWEGGSDRMRNSNTFDRWNVMAFRRMVRRKLGTFERCHQGVLWGRGTWPMIFHYTMWVIMAVLIIGAGAMNSVQQEILMQEKVNQATAAVFISLPLKALPEIQI